MQCFGVRSGSRSPESGVFDEISDADQKLAMFMDLKLKLPQHLQPTLQSLLTSPFEFDNVCGDGGEKEDDEKKHEKDDRGTPVSLKLLFCNREISNMYCRHLEITGIIRDGQKEISYINLCSQINETKMLGYSPVEIVSVFKKCIVPGTGLRMIQFLRGYCK